MTGLNRPPKGEPFFWLTLDMLKSDAWWSLSRSGLRFVTFLAVEHMHHGGRRNGLLKAPHRQLVDRVTAAANVARAIEEAEQLGWVDCFRGGMRVATTFALTMLPLHDGTPATNRWQGYRNPNLVPWPVRKGEQRSFSFPEQGQNLPDQTEADQSKNLPHKGKAGLPQKSKADGQNLPDQTEADTPGSLPHFRKALLREPLTTAVAKGLGVPTAAPTAPSVLRNVETPADAGGAVGRPMGRR